MADGPRDIGGAPQTIEPATRRTLQGLIQAVRGLLGFGDPLDKAITQRLVSDGTITLIGGGGGGGGGFLPVPGPIGPPGPPGGTSEPDLTPPPTPTGFLAFAGFSFVNMQWDAPLYTQGHGHGQSNVYGAKWPASSETAPTFGKATLLMAVPGAAQILASYATEPSTRWCLWLKWQTKDGVESAVPAGGLHGVQVETALDVALVLEALVGKITRSQLYADLGAPIDLITAPDIGLVAKIAQLEQTYGSTLSSAANAAAALQAKIAAELAGYMAEAARDASAEYAAQSLSSSTVAATRASQASTSATQASQAGSDAAGAAAAASTSATTAANSAFGALGSATAASSSQAQAATSATAAGTAATSSTQSANTATTAAGTATTKASAAAVSEQNAAGSANSASSSAINAANSSNAAGGAAGAAAGSASTAGTHATNAGNSATAANASRVAAESAAGQSDARATAAGISASTASTKADAAGLSATSAQQAATTAGVRAGEAAGQAANASTYAGQASQSATNAAGSASAAASIVSGIQAGIAGTFSALYVWDLSGTADGWSTFNSAITPGNTNSVLYAIQGTDPQLYAGVTPFPGHVYDKVRMRLRLFSGAAVNWEGDLYYAVPGGHSWANEYRKAIAKPASIDSGGWTILEWDMFPPLSVGADDWVTHTINALRFDLVHDASGSPVFEVDSIAVGRVAPAVSESKVASIETAIVTGDEANASRINFLKSSVAVRPNIIKNGGFERGMEGWTFNNYGGSGTTFAVNDNIWGRYAYAASGPVNGTGSINSLPFDCPANVWIVVTGDSELYATSGTTWFDVLFYNSANAHIGGSSVVPKISAPHGFSPDGTNRVNHTARGLAPAGTVRALVRCVYEDVVNATAINFRQVKAEFSDASSPASPYTSEATLVVVDAAIKSEASTRATQYEAIASSVTTLQSTIAARVNLVPNGGFENGLTGWANAIEGWSTRDTVWGRAAECYATSQSLNSIDSPRFLAQAGAEYVVTADTALFIANGSGYCYVDIIWLNGAGTVLGETGERGLGADHDFSTSGENRSAHAVSGVAPPGAILGYGRFVWYLSNPAALRYMGVRQFKVERGALPATPYTVEGSITNLAASLQVESSTRASLTDGLRAQWSLKTDLNGIIAGFGLASESPIAGPSTSLFLVRADMIGFSAPTGYGIAPATPFVVRTTPTVENGIAIPVGVYMDAAYMVNLTAMYAKIASLVADSIHATEISATRLTLGDGTVGGNLRSANFISGIQGWILRPDGSAQLPALAILGQLAVGQIDTRGLTIRRADGTIILDASGLRPAYLPAEGLNSNVTAAMVGAETIRLVASSTGVEIKGNSVRQTDEAGGWTRGAYSNEAFVGGCAVSAVFRSAAGSFTMFGLNTNIDVQQSDYGSIDYAIYSQPNGVEVYESGVYRGTFFPAGHANADVPFMVVYDGTHVRYYRAGYMFREVVADVREPMHFDCSMGGPEAGVFQVSISPVGNSFTGSGNLVYNSDFNIGADKRNGWSFGNNADTLGGNGVNLSADWFLSGAGANKDGSNFAWISTGGPTGNSGSYTEFTSDSINVNEAKRYVASAYTGAHRCKAELIVYQYGASGNYIGASVVQNVVNDQERAGGNVLEAFKRIYAVVDIPQFCYSVRIGLRKWSTISGQDSFMFVGKVQFEQIASSATTPTPWSLSGSNDQTAIRGGNPITAASASTYIAAAAIGTAQVGVLTANNLSITAVSGTINGGSTIGIQMDAVAQGGRIRVLDGSGSTRVKIGYLL